MNRISNLFILAVLVLAAVSCAKSETQAEDGIPAVEPVVDTGFSAYVEGDRSRTSVNFQDGGKVIWTTDDPILVSNGTESQTMYIKQGGGTGSSLYTSGTVITGDAFYAIYPAVGSLYESGVFNATIPVTQTYKENGFSDGSFPMVAACGADRQLAFKNAASLLRIVPTTTFYAGTTVTGVTVTADQNLAGAISVNYTHGGTPSVTCSGSKTVTLAIPSGVDFGTPIFVVVAPGSYTGMTITLTMSSGMKYVHNAGTVAVDRSKFASVEFAAIDNYVDLSASETANCYMIKQPGSYKFKATIKGNGVTTSCGLGASTTGIASVKTYYSDGQTFISGGLIYQNDYVYFTTVEGTLPTGTALISVVDAYGTTLWSWHLWSNSLIADVKLSDNSTWLNMNLGAHQVNFNPEGYNGYYYQWGRKDPIQQAKGVNNVLDSPFVTHASKIDGSLANSIKNPLIFYGCYKSAESGNVTIADWCTFDDSVKYYDWWNKNITGDAQLNVAPAKTMFDPCPPGYHLPTHAELLALGSLSYAPGADYGALIEGKLYFPCTSFRAAGINATYWNNEDKSRGYYNCTNPKTTGNRDNRMVYRMYVIPTTGKVGFAADSENTRATALVVRCKKD